MIHLDFETYSECDLKKCGAWVYSEHPTTEILCMAFAIAENPVVLWEPGQPFPVTLKNSILKGAQVEAHNAFFERSIWENIGMKRYGFPPIKPDQWRCSAAKVAARALPRALGNAAAALSVQQQKDLGGKALMLKMCKPYRTDVKGEVGKYHDVMDLWRLGQYCKQDVEAERAVSEVVKDLSPFELKVWQLDQKINYRGIMVDIESCKAAILTLERLKESLVAEFLQLTGSKLKSPTQRDRLLEWLSDEGTQMNGMTKNDVLTALGGTELSPTARRVLEIRQQLSKTSTAKFQAMLNSAGKDGRIRDTLMYHGAGTGRWTGKLVQMQNMPRGTVEVNNTTFQMLRAGMLTSMDEISSCLRGMLIAAPGKEFIAADYNAIEARVLFWLCDEERGLDYYQKKEDLYVAMAKKIYPTETIITKVQRTVGKTTVLGCGYSMGAKKFQMALELQAGVKVDENFAKHIVDTYRQTFPAVPKQWYAQEAAAVAAIRNPGKKVACGKVIWGFDKDDVLYCRLPSGRLLAYNQPRLKPSTKWEGKMELSCMVAAQGVWVREATYGGKLVENIVQAIARDILAYGMLATEDNGMPIVLSVHDEIVVEVPDGKWDPQMLIKFMTSLPSWAYGCPIEAEAWKGKRYKK